MVFFNLCAALLLLITLSSGTDALPCEWTPGVGKLIPYIASGTPKTVSATDEGDCRAQCMQQTSFICASVNYNGGTQNCELLAENNQTASINASSSGWRYSIRPLCAGLWAPWTAVRGKYLTTGVVKYNNTQTLSLRGCMSSCLQDVSTSYNCSSVVKDVTSNAICQLVNKRSDDAEITSEVNTDNQYFNRPFLYLDISAGATDTKLSYYGAAGKAFQLLINYKIPVDGYLVAWKYWIGHTDNYCDSYAAIWRQTGTGATATFYRITETLLRPEDPSTGGARFQFVQNSMEVVRKGDLLALYVGGQSESGCSGNVVSYRVNIPGDPPALVQNYNSNLDRADTLSYSQLRSDKRSVAIRAYISELFTLSENPQTSHTQVSTGQIKLTWQLPDSLSNQELAGSGYVKIQCSDDFNFNTEIDCHPDLVPINYRETVISTLNIKQLYYAKVSTVRNYNGDELIENTYSVNDNSLFCAERGRLSSEDISVTESGILKPGKKRTITVSIPSLIDDDCVATVNLTNGGGQFLNINKTGPWIFSKDQGVTYELNITVRLIDGHDNIIIWKQEYNTSRAPPPPEDLTSESLTPTSGRLSWSPLEYTDQNHPIQQYQVDCKVINNTYNNTAELNSTSDYFTPNSSTTSLHIQPLHRQVKYSCTVKALLADGGFGESSDVTEFWTRPKEVEIIEWENATTQILWNDTITILLPQITDNPDDLIGYDTLVVAVEKLSSLRKRSITYERIDNKTVYITAAFPITNYSSPFVVGDNQMYGGYRNKLLTNGTYYYIWVGFKSKTEQNVLKFYGIPGVEEFLVISNNTVTTVQSTPEYPEPTVTEVPRNSVIGPIIGATLGTVVLIGIVIVIVIVIKRRNSSASTPEENKDHVNLDVIHVRDPPSNGARDNNPQPEALIYDNVGLTVDQPSFPLTISQLRRVIQEEKRANPEHPFKKEFSTIGEPLLKCEIGRQQACIKKNRFKNIIATDENRVVLKVADGFDSDYVNANYIKDYHGKRGFIASQGPKDSNREDMWRLIHDANISTIVMLTNPIERNKKKCSVYWAEELNQSVEFGKFKVTLVEEQEFAEYEVRKLKYVYNQVARHVKQFHFTQWPDHGVPTTTGLLSFRHRVKQDMATHISPTLIHCSAGVGRTGTFIGLDILIDEARATSANGADGTVDVMKCVYNMRCQRTQMVQTDEQYAFLHEILADELDCGDSSIVCSLFADTLRKWQQQNKGQSSILQQQYRRAIEGSPHHGTSCTISGMKEQDMDKNRHGDILPVNKYRVILPDSSHTGYINAVFCDGYQTKKGFIVTQTPLTNTVQDFWQMIVENRSAAIVYFNDCQNEEPHWPDKVGKQTHPGKIIVQNISSEERKSLGGDKADLIESKLSCESGRTKHDVTIIEVKMAEGQLPSTNQLISLCRSLEKFATSGHDIITVQCSNGSRLSGIFVVAMNLYLRARIEQEVDIVLEVKLARRCRPQFVSDFESFNLLYEFVSSYMADFSEYSNFR